MAILRFVPTGDRYKKLKQQEAIDAGIIEDGTVGMAIGVKNMVTEYEKRETKSKEHARRLYFYMGGLLFLFIVDLLFRH